MGPITGRSVVVTGDGRARRRAARRPRRRSASPRSRSSARSSPRTRCATRWPRPTRRLHGIDQVVHTWLAPGSVAPHRFVDLDRRRVGRRVRAQPRRRVVAGARQRGQPLRASSGSLVFVVPTIGMAGAAEFSMLAAVAEGVRVLAKACGRQWGVDGATVNTVAAAPHHWVDADTADALTRGISLSTPAFGGHGERGRRPRAADRAARRPRRALPHRGDAGRRRRHLGGPVTASSPTLLAGKTVLVTGAGGGVGRGIALACATHGANVVIAARRTETGDVVAGEIEARGGAARSIRCDVDRARRRRGRGRVAPSTSSARST